MKIALLIPTLKLGGAERVMLNLAKGFIKEGHSVFLVCGSIQGELYSQLPDGLQVIDLRIKRMRYAIPPLVKFLKSNTPDILYTAFKVNNTIAVISKIIARSRVRVYVSEHGFEEIPNNFIGRLKAQFYKYIYLKAESVITVSKGLANYLQGQLKIPLDKIVTIYNPVIDLDSQLQNQKYFLYNDWFTDSKIPVILSVGRLAKIKGYQDLLESFSEINKYREARLIIVGEGNYRKELERLIYKLQLGNSVRLTGYVDNPYYFMSNCTVFVMSSYKEGFGNVLVEALYSGAQLVSTNCPSGPQEILMDGKYGTLVPVGEVNLLKEAILDIIDKKVTYPDGKSRALDFTINKICKEYLQLFEGGYSNECVKEG